MVKKVLTPVIGGVRKMIQVPGANIAAGTTIAEFGTQTVSLAQLAVALARLTPPNTGLIGDGTEATLSVGPGLAGGGPLLGNVSLRLTAPLGAHMQFSDGADGEPGLTIPGLQGPQGAPGAAIPIRGEDGDDGLTIPGAAGTAGAAGAVGPQGMQGEDGEAGVSIPGAPGLAGAAGSPGAAGASGPPGMQGEDAEDPMVIPGVQGLPGLAGANGTAGPAIVIQAEDGEPGMMIPGAQGPQGVQGIPGASGTGAGGGASWAAYLDFDFDDPSWLSRPPVDAGGPHVWSGPAVFTAASFTLGSGALQVGAVTLGGNGSHPEIQMYGPDSPIADQHLYSEYVDSNGTLHFRLVGDARATANDWLTVIRNGVIPTAINMGASVSIGGGLLVTAQGGIAIQGPAATGDDFLTWGQTGQSTWQMYAPASSNDTHIYNNGYGDVMILAGAGNVGIGIAPDSKFYVQLGTTGAAGSAGLRIGYAGSSNNYFDADTQYFRDAANNVLVSLTANYLEKQMNSPAYSTAAGGVAGIIIYNGNGSAQSALEFQVNGVLGARIRSDYVGNLVLASGSGSIFLYTGGDSGAGTQGMIIGTNTVTVGTNAGSAFTMNGTFAVANAPTAASATALVGYLEVSINGVGRKIPYYSF